ncbi:unnamed protein product, partial [Iphiclides podalirius]
MAQKLVILFGLFVYVNCSLLHQVPIPVYLPLQYQEPTPNYNFAYEVGVAHNGDYKRHHESRLGDAVLGQYSLLQPDGVTRTVDYRADDHNGFSAVVSNAGRPNNDLSDRQVENVNDAPGRQSEEKQTEQPWQSNNDQQVTQAPSTLAHTSLIHHVIRKWS